jgi:hypothetical protein
MAALVVLACGCFVVGTTVPLLYGARPAIRRPATTGRLEILSPSPGEAFRGDPAAIPVRLDLRGATIVPLSSLRLVPNEGHVHLYLDGSLVSMTSQLETSVTAQPGRHQLRAEFVAVDHGPFDPRVIATVTFSVQG